MMGPDFQSLANHVFRDAVQSEIENPLLREHSPTAPMLRDYDPDPGIFQSTMASEILVDQIGVKDFQLQMRHIRLL